MLIKIARNWLNADFTAAHSKEATRLFFRFGGNVDRLILMGLFAKDIINLLKLFFYRSKVIELSKKCVS